MWWLLALVPALLLVAALLWFGVGYARFLGYHRHKGLERPPGPFLPYVFREAVALVTLPLWHLRAAYADRLRTPARVTGPPVLCLHGISQTGSNLWGMRRALEACGRPTRALSFGRFPSSRRRLAELIGPELKDLAAGSVDGTVDVIAHSLGGVVLRVVLADHPELAPLIGRVVTLGSPHAGTAGIRGLPRSSSFQRLGRRSTLLAELPTLAELRVTTVAAAPDLVVYPASTCHLPNSNRVDLAGVGHCGLLTRPEAIGAVLSALEAVPG